jgi:hypothetical protein
LSYLLNRLIDSGNPYEIGRRIPFFLLGSFVFYVGVIPLLRVTPLYSPLKLRGDEGGLREL